MSNNLRIKRGVGLVAVYVAAMSASIFLSYELRFDFRIPDEFKRTIIQIVFAVVFVKLISLSLFRQFDSLLSYFGLPDAQRMLFAMGATDILFLALRLLRGVSIAPPRSIILTDFFLSFFALCLIRVGLRRYREHYGPAAVRLAKSTEMRKRLGVYGAGDAGAAFIRELSTRPGFGLRVVAVFDDNIKKWRTQLHGVPVLGGLETLTDKYRELELDEIVIAMPSVPGERLREIITSLNRIHLRCQIVPSITQVLTGKVRVSQIRPVEVEDLLGRLPINLETDRIRELVEGQVVLVTGAGGSIGSELCRQIVAYRPQCLILVERCEIQLFQIEQELNNAISGSNIVSLVADVQDASRMRIIFEQFRPHLVFHAAAHKHVPMMEHQPFEAFRNNTMGTRLLAILAAEFRVGRFILISTDKAINPTSVMGASKRLAEIYLQSFQQKAGLGTKFMAVRFGNVLGSSGSVILTFKKQIAAGGPITVTHPDVIRYFMTIHEAVGLVLQSAAQGECGDIFVLDMGRPVKIVDLARQLIELSGLVPQVDIKIKFVGLRPGEKLFEEINHNTESMDMTAHPKIMRFVCDSLPHDLLDSFLLDLQTKGPLLIADDVKLEIRRLVPEYTPHLEAVAQPF